MQEDSVSSFLSQVEQQEKREQEEKAKMEQEDDERQRQFEKQVMYGDGENVPGSAAQTDSDSGSSMN